MDLEKKLRLPYEKKDKGNKLFREQSYDEAAKRYSKALLCQNHLLKEGLFESHEQATKFINEIQVPCLLNLAA
jgi:hypothetical protein